MYIFKWYPELQSFSVAARSPAERFEWYLIVEVLMFSVQSFGIRV